MIDAAPASDTEAILERLTRLHPKAIDLTLGRTERLLARLGNPERRLAPVVHVAGTNGKGSVIAFLRTILQAAGYRVQAYTSPHLIDFAERIKLTDGQIEAKELRELLDTCERVNAGEPITFFEITTAAAFLAFSREAADITLVEVGLGGRFDSTNVIESPRLTAITPISPDHQAFLGRTLAKIAGEKAGIIKPGVPVVLAKQPKQARAAILEHARGANAPIIAHATRRRRAAELSWSFTTGENGFGLRIGSDQITLPTPALVGAHQYANAAQAAVCAIQLQELRIDSEAITEGVRAAVWPGRLQRIYDGIPGGLRSSGAEIWFDGGHNPGAARALSRTLDLWQATDPRPLYVVVGMIATKQARRFLLPLAQRANAIATVPVASSTAGRPPTALAEIVAGLGTPVVVAESVAATLIAIDAARPPFVRGNRAPRVLITGSLYLASEVLAAR